jgi:predicted transcriptional regulator
VTLTVDLSPELVAALRAMAQQEGLAPDHYIARALQDHVRRHQNLPDSLAAEEAALLKQINKGLPEETWKRYRELVAKRRAATLTPAEHDELKALTNQVELWNARRIELVAALAHRRNIPLARMMAELALSPPPDA